PLAPTSTPHLNRTTPPVRDGMIEVPARRPARRTRYPRSWRDRGTLARDRPPGCPCPACTPPHTIANPTGRATAHPQRRKPAPVRSSAAPAPPTREETQAGRGFRCPPRRECEGHTGSGPSRLPL